MEFYQRLLLILIPMTIVLVLIRVFWYAKSKRSKDTIADETEENVNVEIVKSKRILKFPLFYRITALIVSIFFTLATVILLILKFEEWPYSLIFIFVFVIPYFVMFVLWSLWKVEVFKDGFIYRNFIGKKREYKYKDLEYRAHPKGLKWYFYKDGKKIFCMPYYVKNENSLEKAYRKWKRKNKA